MERESILDHRCDRVLTPSSTVYDHLIRHVCKFIRHPSVTSPLITCLQPFDKEVTGCLYPSIDI